MDFGAVFEGYCADVTRTVVVGRASGGVQQVSYVDTHGSAPISTAVPGVTGGRSVPAPVDGGQPLIADSDEGIVRLPPDANWETVAGRGSAPVYPG